VWAVLVPRYPNRRLLAADVAANALVAGLWLMVRLRGLPIGEEPWTPEPFGFTDSVAAGLEVALVATVLLLLTGSPPAHPSPDQPRRRQRGCRHHRCGAGESRHDAMMSSCAAGGGVV
jgi:hypothetical protein